MMPAPLDRAAAALRDLAASWADAHASERASFQPWLLQFCAALGVPAPTPPTDDYQFELPVRVTERDGRETTNFIDCWKAGHFAMEAKATDVAEGNEQPLRKAFGQVRNYVAHTKGASPPFLMVVDVARTLIVWDRWSGEYGGFPAGRRISLATLHERPEDIRLLQDIFTDPAARDPRGRAQAVTTEIAGKLAELSAAFEERGHDPELVARFLMRCVFCFFAEDVELLPRGLFQRTLEAARTAGGPERVAAVLSNLWRAMDTGGDFGAEIIRRFNGHFFRTVDALPLEPEDVTLLIEAAAFDWSGVEPSIFGTLLVRALDPAERHRLGAEFTPREYIERLVEPTVVEPIRDRWTAVQAHVLQITDETGKKPARIKKDRAEAVKELLDFHVWLRGLRFLDPACGSGNFLYVTMAAVKRIELEVIRELERVRGQEQSEAMLDEVHPRQFFGIEVKHWAREIAELTLWIGYHQFWRETHGGRTPPDPVLEDTGTIECRDAVLAWDEIVHRPEKDRPDPTPRLVHPVTGELVPDPDAKLPYYEYVGARQAEWPQADFIVGNPPYIGSKRMRTALGDGYVEALRQVYRPLPNSLDFVTYWWHRAASSVAVGFSIRAGLITTNSITQGQNRGAIRLGREAGARVVWCSPDHPWTDGAGSAAVTVTMTVLASESGDVRVLRVRPDGSVERMQTVARLNDDLTTGADVATAVATPLLSNKGLAAFGFALHGDGFLLTAQEASDMIRREATEKAVIRPYRGGRDLTDRSRDLYVIDFGYLSQDDARKFPQCFDRVRTRVKPDRDANARESIRDNWWQFGWPRRELREALKDLSSYIATTETAKHRTFTRLDSSIAPDHMVVCIAGEDDFLMAVLSAEFHHAWSLGAGGDLGGNTPRYNKSLCFDPFPFPDPPSGLRSSIAALAARLDSHRKAALARDERVTITGMYNVIEKLRSGEALTPKERAIHEIAACGVLKDIHDELDALVAEAYGWPWPMAREEILERLVALHDVRVEEEKQGKVRWLRPDYQIPRFSSEPAPGALALAPTDVKKPSTEKYTPLPWPSSAVEQLSAVKAVAARVGATPSAVRGAFTGADVSLVKRHLETLLLMGEV